MVAAGGRGFSRSGLLNGEKDGAKLQLWVHKFLEKPRYLSCTQASRGAPQPPANGEPAHGCWGSREPSECLGSGVSTPQG